MLVLFKLFIGFFLVMNEYFINESKLLNCEIWLYVYVFDWLVVFDEEFLK